MASYLCHYKIQVTDINGDTAVVSLPTYTLDTTTLAQLATIMATWVTDLTPMTNGKITRQGLSVLFSEAQYLVGTTPPNSAEYSSVTDGAHIAFANGGGARMAVTVPAPLEHLFGSLSNVVDSTQTDMAQLIADIEAHCSNGFGGNFSLYKGGVKTGRHSRKRATRLVP